jgi:hypothetical protein
MKAFSPLWISANASSARKRTAQSDAAQQGYQRTNLHNKLRRFWSEMPEKWSFQGTWCEANSTTTGQAGSGISR